MKLKKKKKGGKKTKTKMKRNYLCQKKNVSFLFLANKLKMTKNCQFKAKRKSKKRELNKKKKKWRKMRKRSEEVSVKKSGKSIQQNFELLIKFMICLCFFFFLGRRSVWTGRLLKISKEKKKIFIYILIYFSIWRRQYQSALNLLLSQQYQNFIYFH